MLLPLQTLTYAGEILPGFVKKTQNQEHIKNVKIHFTAFKLITIIPQVSIRHKKYKLRIRENIYNADNCQG